MNGLITIQAASQAGVLDKVVDTDRALTLALNMSNDGCADSLWRLISSNWFTIPAYVLAIALIIWAAGLKRGLWYVVAAAVAIGLSDQLCNLVKDSICRLRPSFDADMLEGGLRVLQNTRLSHCYGFFSAHAALSFCLAFCVTWVVSRRSKLYGGLSAAVFYLWAVVVSLSRVFLGKHFLGDILVGAFVGGIIAFAAMSAACHLIKKFSK